MICQAARDSRSWQADKCPPPLPDEAQHDSNLVGFERQADGQSNLAGHVMARKEAASEAVEERTDGRTDRETDGQEEEPEESAAGRETV